jgi:hypothetical protein
MHASMIEKKRVEQIAREVAAAKLGAANVARVTSEPVIDSEGHEALRVTIVIPDDAIGELSGDSTLATLSEMQERLQQAGEERFAFVQYATQKELDTVDDAAT